MSTNVVSTTALHHCDVKWKTTDTFWYQWKEETHIYPLVPNHKNRRLYSENLDRGSNHPFGKRVIKNTFVDEGLNIKSSTDTIKREFSIEIKCKICSLQRPIHHVTIVLIWLFLVWQRARQWARRQAEYYFPTIWKKKKADWFVLRNI